VYVCDEIAVWRSLSSSEITSRLAFNAHEYDSAGLCQGGLYKGFDAALAHTVNKGQRAPKMIVTCGSLVYLISIQKKRTARMMAKRKNNIQERGNER
jgi:hypothetical protein